MKKVTKKTSKKAVSKVNELIVKEFEETGFIVEVGDLIVDDEDTCEITEITEEDGELVVVLKDEDGDEHRYTRYYLSRFKVYKGTREELEKEAVHLMMNDIPKEEPVESSSTDIAMQSSVKSLVSRKRELCIKSERTMAIVNRVKGIIESKTRELSNIVESMEEQVSKLSKLIYVLNLYSGMEEEIVTVLDGLPSDKPLHVLQQLLYMDVEVGDPTNGGWDFDNVEDFDKWLIQDDKYYKMKNYERLLPYNCCVAAVRVRQRGKDYGDTKDIATAMFNCQMNDYNSYTYFLFKNGKKIQRYWIDRKVQKRLFPTLTEFEDMLKKADEDDSFFSEKQVKKEIEEDSFGYKLNFLILQSVVDRLPLFTHLKHLQFFSPDILTSKDVVFVRNDEHNISDGKISWRDFIKDINSTIKEGSRILLLDLVETVGYGDRIYYCKERYYKEWHTHDDRYPAAPDSGIYTVYKDKEEDCFYIKALPSDDIYVSNEEWEETGVHSRARKKRVSFEIKPSDDFVVAYDVIEEKHMSMLDHMMHSRSNRINNRYVISIPQMKTVFDARREELDYEKFFIDLVRSRTKRIFLDENVIKEHISWWKNKNKWKRSMKEDEAKAIRMISARIIKEGEPWHENVK